MMRRILAAIAERREQRRHRYDCPKCGHNDWDSREELDGSTWTSVTTVYHCNNCGWEEW